MARCAVSGLLAITLIGCDGDSEALPRNCPDVVFQDDGLSADLAATGQLLVELARFMEELRDGDTTDADALVAAGATAEVAEIIVAFHRLDLDRGSPSSDGVEPSFIGAYGESLRDLIVALGVDDELRGLGSSPARLVTFEDVLITSVFHRSTGRAVLSAVGILDNDVPPESSLRTNAQALYEALRVTFPPPDECGRLDTGG